MADRPSRRKQASRGPGTGGGEPRPGGAGNGPSMGETLRGIREANGLSLAEVSVHLRIRESFLDALERGDYARLPGPTYAIGFVRSYAELMGLDGAEAVRRFKGEREGRAPHAHLSFPEPISESRIPRGAILLLSVILAVAAYGGWYYLSARDMEVADPVPRVPESMTAEDPSGVGAPGAGSPGPAPEAPPPSVSERSAAEAPGLPVAPTAGEPPGEATTADGGAAIPVPEVQDPESGPEPVPGPGEAANLDRPASVREAAPPAPAVARIVIHAKADSWIQVRGEDRRPLVSRILQAGEIYEVPDEPGLELATGNAGGLEILVDGEPVAALGPFGAVRRGIALDAETLAAGRAQAR